MMSEGAKILKEFAVSGGMTAYSVVPDFVLATGHSAVLPVQWEGVSPVKDFLCDAPAHSSCRIYPGVEAADASESKVIVVNRQPYDQIVESGQLMAEEVIAEDELYIRRGMNPETGGMPECLESVNGLLETREYVNPSEESIRRLSSGQGGAACPHEGGGAAPAVELEYEGGQYYHKVQHSRPRTSLYTPMSQTNHFPPGSYSGDRIT